MAVVIGKGRGGVKAPALRFNQPSGAVRIKASKVRWELVEVVMVTEGGWEGGWVDSKDVAFVESWRVALERADLAILSRMFL